MFKNYVRIAFRGLIKNKFSSLINIGGLAIGMSVAMLIGLWIWDELSFDRYHKNYDRIARVMENDTRNGTVSTREAIPLPLDAEMHKNYGNDFEHIVMMSFTDNHTLSAGDKNISYPGNFMGSEGPEMLTLNMLEGTRNGLTGPSSMLISESVAKALFGDTEPMGRFIMLDNKATFKVSGVYEDLPHNTTFHDVAFMAPWDFYINNKDWIGRDPANWSDNSLFMYVQIAGNADIAGLSQKIKNIKLDKDPAEAKLKPAMFLQPMRKWHLYSEFTNGINTGGAIQYVWLFGIIGVFVLLLACINFMNLSTARSEKRAMEVGIRKAIGSLRTQLVSQFFCESLLIALLAFVFSILVVWLALPFFNEVAGKTMKILWSNIFFWLISLVFTLLTGLIAGSYPALYLSSFQPVKILKGTFKTGPLAAVPRKVLVVLQFTVSVILIIGTIVVFKQIQFAKNRPAGYSRDELLNIEITNDDLYNHFSAVRADLLKSGAVTEMAGASSPATGINNNRDDVSWKGKDPAMTTNFGNIHVTTEYGKTVGWQFADGRDFSRQFLTDSTAVILNEAAVKYMSLKNPVGEIIQFGKRNAGHRVIGVIKDMLMGSPYEPVKQIVYSISNGGFDDIIIKINPNVSAHDAINKIAAVCKIYSPSVPFSYKFVDDEYAKKFTLEERIGKLASLFAVLAIFISCLGLFGMASFVAERRTKEIGVRKVLGASVYNLWRLLSKDFVLLVSVACAIAIPVAYTFLHDWLQSYEYRTEISWWIFVVAASGALIITLLTVSFQSIKAALMNPVQSLRTE